MRSAIVPAGTGVTATASFSHSGIPGSWGPSSNDPQGILMHLIGR
jgi:hypothetical protein